MAASVKGQAAGEGEGGPTHQPIVHILVGKLPEGAQQRHEQQRVFPIAAWATARSSRGEEVAAPLGIAHRHAAEREQTQLGDEREGIDVQSRSCVPLSTAVGWRRNGYWELARNR